MTSTAISVDLWSIDRRFGGNSPGVDRARDGYVLIEFEKGIT
jgi:hypothetical protein